MVNKGRFNRRGPGGFQHFTSYEGSILTHLLEKSAKFIGISLILVGFGIVVLGYRFSENCDLSVKDKELYQKEKNAKSLKQDSPMLYMPFLFLSSNMEITF